MRKRILSILLSVCMMLTLLPTAAFAGTVTNYGIWVGPTEVTSENMDGVTGDGITGTVTYDASSNTLTLNNATITKTNNYNFAISSEITVSRDLKINLVGSNTITVDALTNTAWGVNAIYTYAKVSIKGSEGSSLSVSTPLETTKYKVCIYGREGVTIEDCAVTATTGNATGNEKEPCIGINIDSGPLSIKNATVTAIAGNTTGYSYGINVRGSSSPITIADSTVTAIGGNGGYGSYGIFFGGPLSIADSTVTAKTMSTTGTAQALYTALTPAMLGTGVTAQGSTSSDGTGAVTYVPANNATYKWVQIAPASLSQPVISTLAISGSFTAGHNYTVSDLDSYKPTITPNGATITAEGWQQCVEFGTYSSGWSNWSAGVLSPVTGSTYKLRYYATYSDGTVYSNEVTLNVVGNTTSLALTTMPESPQNTGTPITLTATLTGFFPGPGVSGQAIIFKNGGSSCGNAALNADGVAVFSWTPPGTGTYSLTAEYYGSLYNTPATSAAVSYTIGTSPLPTAAAYATDAAHGTDYVLDSTSKILTIKTNKGAAWWSANGNTYSDDEYTVLLANDIDVSGFTWMPIGTYTKASDAIFDGQGHIITGLTVRIEAANETVFAGMFGQFCGSIKNVGLVNVSIAASNTSTDNKEVYVGALAGNVFNANISNCFVQGGNVDAASSIASYAGGLVGYIGNGTAISNCYSTANVAATGTGGCAGGVIGTINSGTVDQCYYVDTATITGTNSNLGTSMTETQMKTNSGTDAMISLLNIWIKQQDSIDYYTWKSDSGETNVGYLVFDALWAEPRAQWGVAGAENVAPDTWVGSGSLADAVAYANGLASGTAYIKLLDHVNTTAALEFAENKTTVLDLNGKTIDRDLSATTTGGNVITAEGALIIKDSSTADVAKQGCITGGYSASNHGGGVSVWNAGTVTLQGGNITGNKTTGGWGGGVRVASYASFIMQGGSITGNVAYSEGGGGVGNEGTFTMTGGSISGNSCVSSGNSSISIGGGVLSLGEFTMSGGNITGNSVSGNGAGGGVFTNEGITLSGNVNISGNTVGEANDNVTLSPYSGHPSNIYITGALTNSTAIGVSIVELSRDNVFIPKAGVFTSGDTVTNSDYISKFVSDNSGFAVIADGSQLKLAAAQAITKTAATNGSFTVKVNGNEAPSAIEGQTVIVTPSAASGYEVDTIAVYKTGDTDTAVTVTNGSFTMPDYAVTVNVTFKVSSTPTYAISGTIKGSDTSAGIPASLQLKNSSGNVGNVVTAAADGSYSITDVPAGNYTIAVSHTGYDSGTITEVTVSNAAITGANLMLTKSSTGLTDAQKLAAAQAAIMAAINRMSFSNSTTAADILSVAQAASLNGVTVAWDNTNEFTKTQATTSAKGSIRGELKLALNQESGGIGIDATIAKLSTGGDNGGGSTTPPSTKPTEPVTGNTENEATVDNKGNASVSLTDKNITDAIADAKAKAAKKGVNAGDITAVIHVTTSGKNADTVTVNLPKSTQEQVISNKISSVQLIIDCPDLTIGIDLAAVTEINRQAKADVQLSATRMDNTKLSGDAKAAIGNRPAYDLKALYGSGKSVTDFGKGSVSVEIPYTLQKGEIAGNVYAVYVDAKGKVTYLTDSSYDAKRGTVVFSTSHFSTYGVAYKASFNFTDINGHWAKDDILFVANRGLMTGTSATTFSPGGSMTRGMFVTALGRLVNADTSTYKQSSFTDVKADAFYMAYIEWGVKNNILVGIGGGKFDPDGLVTREQMAVIMDRYAAAIGFKLPEVHTQNVFADNAKIGAWAAPSVKRVQMAGIIQGKSKNLYDPQGTATRAEVSAVLRRFVELAIFSDTAQGWTMNDSGKWM